MGRITASRMRRCLLNDETIAPRPTPLTRSPRRSSPGHPTSSRLPTSLASRTERRRLRPCSSLPFRPFRAHSRKLELPRAPTTSISLFPATCATRPILAYQPSLTVHHTPAPPTRRGPVWRQPSTARALLSLLPLRPACGPGRPWSVSSQPTPVVPMAVRLRLFPLSTTRSTTACGRQARQTAHSASAPPF